MMVRGIRGATTTEVNTKEAIVEATVELLREIVGRNGFEPDDVAAATFTATPDLNAEFPAAAARVYLGWKDVPLLCAQEMLVMHRPPRSIRVMILVTTDRAPADLEHVYLRGAVNLRMRGADSGGRSGS